MNYSIEDIRIYLLKKGFGQIQPFTGTMYVLSAYDDLVFQCDLKNKVCSAEFPDFKYNIANRFSPKNNLIKFDYSMHTNTDIIIHHIETFFENVIDRYNKERG